MKKRIYGVIAVLAACVLMASGLTACSSAKKANQTTTAAEETTTKAEETTKEVTTKEETTEEKTTKEETTEHKTTEEQTTQEQPTELPPAADEFEQASRDITLDVAGWDKTIVSCERQYGTIGGYTGEYCYIGVQDAAGNITYYYSKPDFALTQEEVDAMNADQDDPGLPPAADEFEQASRDITLDVAGWDKTIISCERQYGTIGGYTGEYCYIGVQDEYGNVTYYYSKPDFAFTQEEVDAMNADQGEEIGPAVDEFEELCREIAVETAGEGSYVIYSELRHDGIGDWLEGDYYYIGVQRPDGSVEYYYCRTDWALTEEEIANR